MRETPTLRKPTFDHLIITRYNMPVSWGRRGHLHADEDWLKERRRLFERYCLPSVVLAERTCPSVTWVLRCAADSPPSLRNFMDQVSQLHPWIIPMYLDESALGIEVVDESLTQRAATPSRFLLTTRLDSDDAVGPNFVKVLQQAAERALEREILDKKELPTLINFPLGCQTVHGRLYFSVDLGNPFVSFLEERSDNKPVIGCYSRPHRDLHQLARTTRQLKASGPSWLQVIHGSNEANVVCGLRGPQRSGLKRFQVLKSEKRSEDYPGGIKEALQAIRNQTVQFGSYCWNRVAASTNVSMGRRGE